MAGATDTESTISTAASLEAPAALPVSPRAGHQSKQGVPQPPQELPSAQDRQWAKKALMEGGAVSALSDMEGAESKASGYALLSWSPLCPSMFLDVSPTAFHIPITIFMLFWDYKHVV